MYFNFIEFTVDDSGYHSNTTRIDGSGLPFQHCLINQDSSYDRTVVELATLTRDEVPNEFKSLMDIQQHIRLNKYFYVMED